MSTTRKSRLASWLSKARLDLDRVAAEIEQMPDEDAGPDVSREVDEVRARVDALESRVQAIEGTPR